MTEPSSSESSPESVPAGGSMTTEPRFELLAAAPAEEEEEDRCDEEQEDEHCDKEEADEMDGENVMDTF